MTGEPDPERPYASTTWRTKIIKLPLPAEGQRHARRSRSSIPGPDDRQPGWYRFRPYDLKQKRKPLQISVVYRGGPECWYEVRARGGYKRFPGHMAIHDIMRQVYND